jgi:hypothetical protein
MSENTSEVLCGNQSKRVVDSGPLFEKKIEASEVLFAEQAAQIAGCKLSTVYDWKYRPHTYGIPQGMIGKRGRRLVIKASLFQLWLNTSTKF